MSRDHLADAVKWADSGDITNSVAYGQIATVEALQDIKTTLADVAGLATAALGVLLDGKDIEEPERAQKSDVDEPVPYVPVPDPEADRQYRAEQLGDHLQAAYNAATTAPVWPVLGTAALDWMEKNA